MTSISFFKLVAPTRSTRSLTVSMSIRLIPAGSLPCGTVAFFGPALLEAGLEAADGLAGGIVAVAVVFVLAGLLAAAALRILFLAVEMCLRSMSIL